MSQQQRTILIVDDSPEDQELYRRYLLRDHEYSYTILEAKLGQQGLELWQQHQPDAILLDYRLPDMNGLEFLAKLQGATKQQDIAVIVVTGQGNEAIAVQVMKVGVQDYLVKEHITPARLQLAVNGAIETVQLRSQLEQYIERARLITQITQKLHQTLNLEEILQTTVTEVRHFLQTDRVVIFQLQADGWGKVTNESVGAGWMPLLCNFYHDPCFNKNYIESFRQGIFTSKSDIQNGSITPCHVEFLAKLQVRANLVVPILQDDQLWGMIIAHHCTAPRQWQSLEIDLLQELATQLGVAIRQAELYQQAQNELVERRQVESALKESEERLRRAVQKAPLPIIMHAEDGEVLMLSTAWTELSGYSHQDIPTITDWIHQAYGQRKESVQKTLEQLYNLDERLAEGEFEITTLQGDSRVWDFSTSPIGQLPDGRRVVISMAMDVTERKNAQNQIKASLLEKEILLKEIHHRVKNNLQIISSLLNLQSEYLQDNQAIDLFEISQQRIQTMALIHEKIYQSESLAKINFAEYIQDLVTSLVNFYEGNPNIIILNLNLDEVFLSLDSAVPCALIINELVVNSLKHAFPACTPGEICIDLCLENDKNHRLTISDNGIGFKQDFDFRNTKSLGLQLVFALTNQLSGTIEVDIDQGVKFEIKFPV